MTLDSNDPIAQKAMEAAQRRAARRATRTEFAARRKAGKALGQRQRLDLLAQHQNIEPSNPPARPVPPRQFRRWSPAENELLAELAAARTPNRLIAERLGRTAATVAVRRSERALTQRPDRCQRCGASLVQAPRGRPRRYCSKDCVNQVSRERGIGRRSIERAAAIAARSDWTCAADGCDMPLPRDHPNQRKYCCRTCCVRTFEKTYAAIRAAKQMERAAAAAAAAGGRAPRTPRPKTTVNQVIDLMDAAGQPDDLCGAAARTWIRHVAGMPAPSEVICQAIRERKART